MTEKPSCPLPGSADPGAVITMGHGSGGRMSSELVDKVFLAAFGNQWLNRLDDSARLDPPAGRLAFSTDSFVVDPLFFPGGDIGELAVNGTVNDLAMSGAEPLWLSAGFILEEGLPVADLERICGSMAAAARRAGVTIVTGDTKVVGRGGCDRIFINTAGIGVIRQGFDSGPGYIRPGDRIILSGPVAGHGMAVMLARGGMDFVSAVESDTAPLNGLVLNLVDKTGAGIRAMRDATRGGVASVLAEFARAAGVGMVIDPTRVPVAPEVASACDILGIDPLFVANEGMMALVVSPESAEDILAACHRHPLGRQAALVGEAISEHPGRLSRLTPFGTRQLITPPAGEILPRIC